MGYDRVCWENQIRASSVMSLSIANVIPVGHTRAESLCRPNGRWWRGWCGLGKGRIVLRPSPDEGRRLDQVESYMLWGKPQNTWVKSKFLVS